MLAKFCACGQGPQVACCKHGPGRSRQRAGLGWLAAGLLGLLPARVELAHADARPTPATASASALDLSLARQRLSTEPVAPVVPLLQRPAQDLSATGLEAVAPARLPLVAEANSEQRAPLHLGASPREQALFGLRAGRPRIVSTLRPLGEEQALRLGQRARERLAKAEGGSASRDVELEGWPLLDEVGRFTWVWSRVRLLPPPGSSSSRSSPSPWRWLEAADLGLPEADPNLTKTPRPILPEALRLGTRDDFAALFDDFLDAKGLYDKPRFGECVWTVTAPAAASAAKSVSPRQQVVAAWLPTAELRAHREQLLTASASERETLGCTALPQPARLNERAMTLRVQVSLASPGKVTWPAEIDWVAPPPASPADRVQTLPAGVKLPKFGPEFAAAYARDVRMLSGVEPLREGNKTLLLRRKSSADPQHQLEALLDLLEARYARLGIPTRRQRFVWRGVPQSNLTAVLRGRPGSGASRPIALADHIDTAFCDDVFNSSGQRVSAPGADDNVTAVATLLRAAEALLPLPREHDIWLVHLTGEEFPADDLGARHFIGGLLGGRQDLGALVLLDMSGFNPKREPDYQLNPGGPVWMGEASAQLAEWARAVSGQLQPGLRPHVHPPDDLRSYLYNTDGVVFAESGFPVLFINEVMNRYRLMRKGYHETTDSVENPGFDFAYAAGIAQVAIGTVALLSQLGAPALAPPPPQASP